MPKSTPLPPVAAPAELIDPMLAKIAEELPQGDGFVFEPKWDGFRAIVFRGASETFIQSRDKKPLNRYFPELERALHQALPKGCTIDGEIVIAKRSGLDFDALQLRLHPAASRVAWLAKETPASFVAFDLLRAGGRSTMDLPQSERRVRLERLLGDVKSSIHLTPMTRDRALAVDWLQRFEGAGLDGVMAKPVDAPYQPGKRAMWKIKHIRSADCVVAGFRWYREKSAEKGKHKGADKDAGHTVDGVTDNGGTGASAGVGAGAGAKREVGSLLLGLYDGRHVLRHVGVASSFSAEMRRQLTEELAPLREGAMADHPWRDWATQANDDDHPMPGAQSRWTTGKDLGWEPLRLERVAEVKYDHMQGDRFRHATTFLHWRLDKPIEACRYDQLEVTRPVELAEVFAAVK